MNGVSPEMQPVISGLAKKIGYDAPTKTLAVEHHDSSVYHYSGVHPLTHAALMNSPSKGKFLHRNVRGKHSHVQIK